MFRSSIVSLAGLAAVAVLVSGCQSCKPGRQGPIGQYSLQVQLDDSLQGKSVVVDLVGVNPGSLERWQGYPMSRYWRPADTMRPGADKVTFDFVSGGARTQTLNRTDDRWKQWMARGVTHVMVLADLPGIPEDRPGAADPRRQILPLDQCHWPKKTTNLVVHVQQSGIDIMTPVRPVK